MKTVSEVRVRYAETDQMGVAHHSSYVAWLELARVDWLRAAGLDYAEIERGGVFFPVVELQIRYRAPARFDEVLQVTTWLQELGSRRFAMAYEIQKAGGVVASARTVHVPQDAAGRARRLPTELFRTFQEALGGQT